jgi:hypothetical protein
MRELPRIRTAQSEVRRDFIDSSNESTLKFLDAKD